MLHLRFLFVLGAAIFFLIGLGYFFYSLQPISAVENENSWIEFKIVKGDSFRNIGAQLSQQSLIKSIAVFKLYALLSGRAQQFQPGIHKLAPTMSVPSIVNLLSTRGANEVAVTIPEGSTMRDIDMFLADAGVIEKGAVERFSFDSLSETYPFLSQITSFEGFLFPDTYRFERDSSTKDVMKTLLDNFVKKGWELLQDKQDWYDVLILASFLEREVPQFEDRRLVAGLLLKRLQAGMPLQIDATISYIKCRGAFLGCETIQVTKKDLGIVSPYNTYQRLGWTPTPITNPGEEALRAALNPKHSSYWYYLSAKETKKTIFSKTLEEHNDNRVRYL